MRVLQTYKVYRPDSEGGVAHAIATIASIPGSEVENSILVARPFGLSKSRVVDGVPVTATWSLGTYFSMPLAPCLPFALAREAGKGDVVIHHAPFPLDDLGLLGLSRNVGLIVYWHAAVVSYPMLRRLVSPLVRRTLDRADKIIVCDETMIRSSALLPHYAQKCAIIPYGIDCDYWEHLDAAQLSEVRELKVKYPRLIVGVGRLVGYKGFDLLIRAMRTIDATAIIVGVGPLRNRLQRLVRNCGVGDRVILAGHQPRDELKVLLHAADVFAFPSRNAAEAFGIAQLEAMAAGKPIVNTALPTAAPKIARYDQEALTVPVDDAPALNAALRRLLDDRELARRLGEAGRARVRTCYDHRVYRDRIKAIIQEVAAHRSAAATR